MQLLQSESVVKSRNDQKLRNKIRSKKKHKRLDAICEKTYNRCHRGVQNVDTSEFKDVETELDLRRSNRTRRAPALLDSSPLPPKKRCKLDGSGPSNIDKVARELRVKYESPCSSSRNLDVQNDMWGSRLRFRGKRTSSSGQERGKKRLFMNINGFNDDIDSQNNDNKEGFVGKILTVVKSKRSGRIKASNVLENGEQEIDLGDGVTDDKENKNCEVFEMDEGHGLHGEAKLEIRSGIGAENGDVSSDLGGKEDAEVQKVSELKEGCSNGKSKRSGIIEASNVLENGEQEIDLRDGVTDDKENKSCEVFEMDEGHGFRGEVKFEIRSDIGAENGVVSLDLCGKVEAEVQRGSELKEGCRNGNMDVSTENMGSEKLSCDFMPDVRIAVQVECAADELSKNEGYHNQPPEDEAHKKLNQKDDALDVSDRKPRIKLGRRCGLCGGGTDGKPPKILLLDGIDSDNEAYSGLSASLETNYDVWDGFGDEPGWLGRLLGPINDRLGIARIWVHQQCAVWSPEVYFAGFGCLKNIRAALYRGRMLKCNRCKRRGATIGCRVDRCPKTYHLPCARAKGCIFDHHKFLIACTDHRRLFQPHGIQNAQRLRKMKAKRMKLELRKMSNEAHRKDIEVEEKWLENCGEDEEFLKRESRRLHRDLGAIAPVYIGGTNSKTKIEFEGWESVAGLKHVIQCMKEVVILPLLYPEFFKNLGLTPPRGVLLHGYPGTGKTLVVRALVGSCARGDKRIAYFARKGADCLGKYVGDSERQLRLLFQVAEKSQPSIIFFDEIDGLAPCRSKQQDQTHSSVVSTLLALMDGLKSRGSVIVIGATNRPEAVDPALRRPGRFDREIHFPLPLVKDREAILSLHTQKWPNPLTGSLLKWVAERTVGFAGADLQALCTQAAIIALRRSFPLQEVLSAAETRASHSKVPPIPTFSVEERDWLKAFSFAPPPCSQREGGVVVNDVVSSPLDAHLVPCLVQPLIRLLVLLYLDERVWLPPPLKKISISVKNVFVSALDMRKVQSDNWQSHVDDLLQEVNVTEEIAKNFSFANAVVGEAMLPSSYATENNSDETFSKLHPPIFRCENEGLKNMPYTTCNNPGFQMLISGKPRCGQRHLASSLLYYFVGNVDVWKVDLASISQEGHGDMVHGLTRLLMRCGGGNLCMIYMPKIDLWTIEETHDEATGGSFDLSAMESQYCETISFQGSRVTVMEHELCPGFEPVAKESQAALKNASNLWTLFIEQVESLRVNTPLIILATSELPFPLLPHRVRQFFGSDIVNKSISSTLDNRVPQFSVQLDGKFDHDRVINSFATKLLKDLVQHFIGSTYDRNHFDENVLKNKADDMVERGANRLCSSKSCPVSPAPLTNRSMKGKSNLFLAISTFGYQILCFPHFAELCWVTSKLKEGPSSNVDVPFKGWPFNSCILRPINSTEKAASASGSSNMKSLVSGFVRGLVSVGLSAYRGEYTSLKEVCSDVRKVLEVLVERIDDKIQAGKDRSMFVRLLSQVAYLEDMVLSWAHALQSLEVDYSNSETPTNVNMGSLADDVCKNRTVEAGGVIPKISNGVVQGSELFGKHILEDGGKEAGLFDPTNDNDVQLNTGEDVVGMGKEPPGLVALDYSCPNRCCLGSNDSNLLSLEAETAADMTEFCGNDGSLIPSNCNGFTENCYDSRVDCHHGSHDKNNIILSSATITCHANGLSLTDNMSPKGTDKNTGLVGLQVNHDSNPTGFTGGSSVTCCFQCCSYCVINLWNLLVRIIGREWICKGTDLTVEDVHDFVSSLSANLHVTLDKMSRSEGSCGGTSNGKYKKPFECQKCRKTGMTECLNFERGLINECDCHSRSKSKSKSKYKNKNATVNEGYYQMPGGTDSSFIFRDGVLINLDTGMDISYHCKFKKLCLCPLIEWLVMSKMPFD